MKSTTRKAAGKANLDPLVRLLAPLTAEYVAPWRPDPDRADTIIGEWAEDGSHYTLVVPTQLRPAIIAMQNELPRLLANNGVSGGVTASGTPYTPRPGSRSSS